MSAFLVQRKPSKWRRSSALGLGRVKTLRRSCRQPQANPSICSAIPTSTEPTQTTRAIGLSYHQLKERCSCVAVIRSDPLPVCPLRGVDSRFHSRPGESRSSSSRGDNSDPGVEAALPGPLKARFQPRDTATSQTELIARPPGEAANTRLGVITTPKILGEPYENDTRSCCCCYRNDARRQLCKRRQSSQALQLNRMGCDALCAAPFLLDSFDRRHSSIVWSI